MPSTSVCAGRKLRIPMNNTDLIQLDRIIREAGSVAISGHEHPDGDCAGSTTALYWYVKNVCPEAEVDLYLEKIPDAYAYIGEDIPIRHSADSEHEPYDLFISLDCGVLERLGFALPVFEKARKTVCIDHHYSNPGYADINRICPNASSTSELLAEEMDPQYINDEIARDLFLGISHDSGVFQYPSTSPKTHRIAANLMEYDFNASDLITRTYYERTFEQQKIGAQAIENAFLMLDGRVIVSMISMDEMERCHVQPQDLDAIVAGMRDTTGVECAAFMYEKAKGEWKVSLRSRTTADMSAVAKACGGGGHRRASGATFYTDDPEEIMRKIIPLIEQQLDS